MTWKDVHSKVSEENTLQNGAIWRLFVKSKKKKKKTQLVLT